VGRFEGGGGEPAVRPGARRGAPAAGPAAPEPVDEGGAPSGGVGGGGRQGNGGGPTAPGGGSGGGDEAPRPEPKPEPKPAPKPPPKPEPKPEPALPEYPGIVSQPRPDFDRAGVALDRPVTVTVTIRVAASGRVESVSATGSSGYSAIDAAAVSACRRWRFAAGRRGKSFVQTFRATPE
jgi:TonB family protein